MKSRRRRLALGLLFFLVLALILPGCITRILLYPGAVRGAASVPPPGWEEIPGGTWHLPTSSNKAPVLLLCHGNGETLGTAAAANTLDAFRRMGCPLVALEYPGFGGKQGIPSEATLLSAGDDALAWIAERYPERPVVVCGWSLGAGVAVQSAARHPEQVKGLIALSPFTTLADAAETRYPRWLVWLLLRDRYDSLGASARIRCPALVVHGRLDKVIPVGQGKRIAEALSARWIEVPGSGHDDLLYRSLDGIADFLQGCGCFESVRTETHPR